MLDVPKPVMPVTECIFQGAIQDMSANLEEALNGTRIPSHLLLLHHSLTYDLVDCRLHEAG
jgi:hypothetical protein